MALETVGLYKFHNRTNLSDTEDIPSILESDLTTLTLGQRLTFAIIVSTLCICSVFGNVGSLFANKTRKLRVFFRTCLISLALSDLITSLFTTVAYMAQFGGDSVQIWCIGGLLCRMIPFLTTGAILVSSVTLVGIALDRYYAVMKAVNGFWKPNKCYSIVITVVIWILSFFLAFHVFFAYSIYQVYVLTEVEGSMELGQIYLVSMCVSSKEANAYYYLFVLAIIFIPTLVAFVWLNSIIANKLWIRRHSFRGSPSPQPSSLPSQMPISLLPASQLRAVPATTTAVAAAVGSSESKEKQMEMISQQYQHHHHLPKQQQQPTHCRGDNKICISSTLTVPTSLAPASTASAETKLPRSKPKPTVVVDARIHNGSGRPTGDEEVAVVGLGNNSPKHISCREARHLRMFTIVLILMAVFIFFRLPAWIFLIMRMYGSYTHRIHWILHFCFGILTLTSCVLNPLLYTFLAETIQYAMFMKGKLCGLRRYFGDRCGLRRCLCCHCYCCLVWRSNTNDDSDNKKMTQNQHQNANQNDNNDDDDDDDGDDNANDKDCTSNDGAKSTSKKSDDDSKVYTIIPVSQRQDVWSVGGVKKQAMAEDEGWCHY